MQQNNKMDGCSSRYGAERSFPPIPINGKLRITSMALPTHMLAITPQNRSGRWIISCGPGVSPCIISAPIISAMVPVEGMPSVLAARAALVEMLYADPPDGSVILGEE